MPLLATPRWLRRRDTGFAASLAALAVTTALLAPVLDEDQLFDVALLYLLVTLLAAGVWGYLVGLATAVLASLAVNFFFVTPLHTFTVQQPENVVALLIFLAVAIVGASMLSLLRQQAAIAIARQTEASVLLEVNQAVARAPSPRAALEALCATIARALHVDGCAILVDHDGWRTAASTGASPEQRPLGTSEVAAATTAVDSQAIARLLDPSRAFAPFPKESGRGALRIVGRPHVPTELDTPRLLLALATEAGIAVHRAELAEEAGRAAALEHSDELKTALLSSVSHDLRTPLTAIKAAVGSLRDVEVQWTSEDTQGFLETIESQTDRLTAVVADLLEISRLEDGKVALALEPIQVELLLTEVARAAALATPERRVTIEARPDLWVRADYGLITQALTNLVDNAARYSVPRGAIRLTAARAAPATVAISVVDEGPGIPAEDLPHVFEKFYRGVQARRSKGTGLGLAIAEAMVKLCDGTLTVASSLRGTEFTVELPATEAPR
jgi:two-component system sensor histidine kinase KdpD